MKNPNFSLLAFIVVTITFFSFNYQNKPSKLEGMYKLIKINDKTLPAYSEEGSERITISGIIFFTTDGKWSVLSKEKDSKSSKIHTFGMLIGRFEIKNETIILYDDTLNDTYTGRYKGNDILIVSENNGQKNTYLFSKVEFDTI